MLEPRTEQDKAKLAAGRAAVERYVEAGRTIGLGSGTTSHWFVRALGEAVTERGLDVTGVVTSSATRRVAEESGVPLIDIDDADELVVTIDGADEIDRDGAMIKGGGACLLWEKIVAHASERMVAVVDPSKVVTTLGAFPLPVEVIRFGWTTTERLLRALLETELGYPAGVAITQRMQEGEPLVTDSGNYILDAHLEAITDKDALADALNDIPGVVEHGLFRHEAREMLIGKADGSFEVTTFG